MTDEIAAIARAIKRLVIPPNTPERDEEEWHDDVRDIATAARAAHLKALIARAEADGRATKDFGMVVTLEWLREQEDQ